MWATRETSQSSVLEEEVVAVVAAKGQVDLCDVCVASLEMANAQGEPLQAQAEPLQAQQPQQSQPLLAQLQPLQVDSSNSAHLQLA